MKPLLTVENLSAGYEKRDILRGVSFQLRAGELCALLGLNGSGKSTLLKALCGLLPCRADALSAAGTPLRGLSERKRARLLAYIPQRTSAGSGLTVADMLLMGYNPHLGLLDRPSRSQRAAACRTLETVGLAVDPDRMFDALSEGQRQLVIFARALVQDAPVMLLDEPDSALDYVNRHLLLGRVSKLVRRERRAGLVTLHDPNFAMAYCDRLLLMKDGVLTADVDLSSATDDSLTAALKQLYGPVKVAQVEGQRFLLRT